MHYLSSYFRLLFRIALRCLKIEVIRINLIMWVTDNDKKASMQMLIIEFRHNIIIFNILIILVPSFQ